VRQSIQNKCLIINTSSFFFVANKSTGMGIHEPTPNYYVLFFKDVFVYRFQKVALAI
jgi:hypothetical protein